MSKDNEAEYATQWFMGSALMDKYYWVFDSYKYPTSENPTSLSQIGLALKEENAVYLMKN
jgi:hypothetical protein